MAWPGLWAGIQNRGFVPGFPVEIASLSLMLAEFGLGRNAFSSKAQQHRRSGFAQDDQVSHSGGMLSAGRFI